MVVSAHQSRFTQHRAPQGEGRAVAQELARTHTRQAALEGLDSSSRRRTRARDWSLSGPRGGYYLFGVGGWMEMAHEPPPVTW